MRKQPLVIRVKKDELNIEKLVNLYEVVFRDIHDIIEIRWMNEDGEEEIWVIYADRIRIIGDKASKTPSQ